jgi:hypothetical protein
VTISAYALSADGLVDPVTVSHASPLLSWKFRAESADQPTPQRVRVQAAFSRKELEAGDATAWDTGWLESDHHLIEWAGEPLGSRSRVWWRVAIGDADGPGTWSAVAAFELALLEQADWIGQWVTHPEWIVAAETDPIALPVITLGVPAVADAVRARLYIAAAGVFTVQVNGAEITEDMLAPGYSDYDTRIGARAYDITEFLDSAGPSEVTIGLGTGIACVRDLEDRYSKLVAGDLLPRVLAQAEVTDRAGTIRASGTGGDSRAWLGATTLSHWFGGEDYDARREDAARNAEAPAAVLGDVTLHPVWWPQYPTIRPTEHLRPVAVTRTPTGRIYDFGTNSAGAPVLALAAAKAGRTIKIWPSELLGRDGDRIAQTSTGSPIWDTYITREGDQQWQPRYVYHGFRYLFVEGLEEQDSVSAVVFHAQNELVGDFATSKAGLTKLHSMIVRALESNMFSVFTDCPHREKLGWLEEVHLVLPTMVQVFDLRAHLRDTVQHIIDAQLPDGSVPNVAPEFVNFAGNPHNGDREAFRFDPNWGSAIVHVPWGLYKTYEDASSLRLAWQPIVRYLAHLAAREGQNGLLDFGLGDWIALDQSTPRPLAANHGYCRTLEAAARIAAVLGHDEERGRWQQRADLLKKQLAARMSSDGLSWGTDNQASLALALDADLVTCENRPAVLQRLVDLIDADNYAVTLGEIALPALVRVLSAAGRDDILLRLVENVDGAGYGHQIASDDTTLAEAWIPTGDPEVEGSQNHFMLGMIDDWLRERVAGLAQAPGSTGWRRVTFDPADLPGIDRASIRFDSPRGEIRLDWDAASGGRAAARIQLPPGVTLAATLN